MAVFLLILLNVIFPVFLLMGMGVLFQRIYQLDLRTLSKITTNYLLPVVGFINIYQSQINLSVFIDIVGFQATLVIILMMVSAVMAKLLKLDKGMTANFKNSVVLMNSGNYGLPVSQLVFQSHPLGLTVQVIVMTIQNFVTFTYGLLNSVSVHYQGTQMIKEFFKMPMLYALILGVGFQYYHFVIPDFLWQPLVNVSDAFLAMALFALGAQVAYIKVRKIDRALIFSNLGRLILSPLIALGIIYTFHLTGVIAQALFIASAFPSSRNSAQLALEYNNYPESAGQIVLISTLLSSVTVSLVVYLSSILF